MEKSVIKLIANGLVFYSFGFVLFGHDVLAMLCAIGIVAVLFMEFDAEQIFANWEYMALTALAELIVIQRSGMAVTRSSLFIVSVANLMHAYTWCTFDYERRDYVFYRSMLALFVFITFLMPALPLGFVETMLVIFLVFLPYTLLAREKERAAEKKRKQVSVGKKHLTVIQ